jgi:hypothetical protein
MISLFSSHSFARWASSEEADSAMEKLEVEINVNKDATSQTKEVVVFRILKETARERWGTLRFGYSPKNQKFRISDAGTENDKEKFSVQSGDIVDTAIGANEYGFDEQRQVVLPFKNLKVGSAAFYTTESTTLRPIMGQFSSKYILGERSAFKNGHYVINSAIPLYFQINDPKKALEFKDLSKEGFYKYDIKIKNEIFQRVVDEDQSYLPDSEQTWFAMASSSDYKTFFAQTVTGYEDILKQTLPLQFKKIADEAKTKKTSLEQINFVTSSLAESIRYMGDWRAVDGGYIPHNLADIANLKYGDCKDYSTVIVRILRELGMNAHVALVERAKLPSEMPKVPWVGSFNHAIATVQLDEKSPRLWIDGTNFQSYAAGVMEDIAFREALILDPKDIRLAYVDYGPAERNRRTYVMTSKRLGKDTVATFTQATLTGRDAVTWAGQELRFSHEQLTNSFLTGHLFMPEVLNYKMGNFSLKNRVVEDFKYTLSAEKYLRGSQSSMGAAMYYRPYIFDDGILKLDGKTQVSSFDMGLPGVYRMEMTLTKFPVAGRNIKKCEVVGPNMEYRFDVKYNKDGFWTMTEYKIKKRFLSAEESRSAEFTEFQKKLKSCSAEKFFVYR